MTYAAKIGRTFDIYESDEARDQLVDIGHAADKRLAAAEQMAQALDHIKRRLLMDINDGSRPDQWSMEDLVRTSDKATAAWEAAK